MFEHLLESSYQDDSNKWSNIEFGEEIMMWSQLKLVLHILSRGSRCTLMTYKLSQLQKIREQTMNFIQVQTVSKLTSIHENLNPVKLAMPA